LLEDLNHNFSASKLFVIIGCGLGIILLSFSLQSEYPHSSTLFYTIQEVNAESQFKINQIINMSNPEPDNSDHFGYSLAVLDNNRIVVGAPGNYVDGKSSGSIYIVDSDGNILQTIDNPEPDNEEERFGYSLAVLDNNRIVVGAPDDDVQKIKDAGSVYVFDIHGNILQTIENPEPIWNDHFGNSVSVLDNNKIVVGAPDYNLGKIERTGVVYIIDSEGNILQTIKNPEPSNGDHFGNLVMSYGDYKIVVGAPEDDGDDGSKGVIYIFDINGTKIKKNIKS